MVQKARATTGRINSFSLLEISYLRGYFGHRVLRVLRLGPLPLEEVMPVSFKKIVRAASVLVFLVAGLTSQVSAQVAPMPAPITKDFAADLRPEEFTGALDIRIHPEDGKLEPPAELLLKDPMGRRIGLDLRRGQTYREIPLAHYEFEGIDDAVSGAPGPQTGIIEIRNPVPGKYTLEIIGKETGYYSMSVRGYDRNLEASTIAVKKAKMTPGTRRTFSFTYSDEVGKSSVAPVTSGND
jgi:hypothetical protein